MMVLQPQPPSLMHLLHFADEGEMRISENVPRVADLDTGYQEGNPGCIHGSPGSTLSS